MLFALWTLSCHAACFGGGSLRAALAGFAALAAALLAWRLSPWGRAAPPAAAAAVAAPRGVPTSARRRGLLAGAGLLVAVLLQGAPVALWWASLALLVAAAVLVLPGDTGSAGATGPGSGRASGARAGEGMREAALWGLALGCAAIASLAHRVDIDDAFYVNLALAAAAEPGLPLMAGDTLHGVPGLPLHMAVYRLHSWELWNAALAYLSGLPAIVCFHVVSAALAAALAPLAAARLLRQIAPSSWLQVVVATLWVLLVAADTHRGYANFGFVRIWQGKAVLLLVLLPLVQAYAIAFARRPSPRGLLLLAAAQVAAVGATSSALWAGPFAALAAAACAVPLSRRGLARLGLVLLSSGYVLGVGLVVKAELETERQAARTVEASQEEIAGARRLRAERYAPGVQLAAGLDAVAGEGPLRAASWATLLVTWAALPAGLGRRFAITVPLAALVVLLNPYWSGFLADNVVGPSTWRAFWALPVPLLMGLLLTAPLAWLEPHRLRGHAAALLAALGFALLIPRQAALSEANGVTLGAPGLKVPEEAYALARTFARTAEPGAFVVAPPVISVWLPTLEPRTFPLVVRHLYLTPYRRQLGDRNLRWRVLMSLYSEGKVEDPAAPAWFERGLEHFDVQAVFLWLTPEAARARRILERAGFRAAREDPEWEIWVRP